MNASVDITVVLCTYNRAAWLRDVVASLSAQATDDAFTYELLIVDNASTDDTREVTQALMASSDLPMRYVCETTPGVSAARNRGIREASGQWVAFCDDDQLADPRWLAELFALSRAQGCRVVGGAVHLVRAGRDGALSLNDDSDQRLSAYLERLLAPGGRSRTVQRFHRRDALNSGNQMVHREVFQQVGGYNDGCREGGEDTDWFVRLTAAGIDAWFTPNAIVRHMVPDYRLTVDYLRWVSLRQGWGMGRHQVEHRGLLFASLVGIARGGQVVLQHGPLLIFARLTGQESHATYRRCQMWRATGFTRFLLRQVFPGVFPQQDFRSWIEFRGEREQFAQSSLPSAVAR